MVSTKRLLGHTHTWKRLHSLFLRHTNRSEMPIRVKSFVRDFLNFNDVALHIPSLRYTLFAVDARKTSRSVSTCPRVRAQHGAISRDAKPFFWN